MFFWFRFVVRAWQTILHRYHVRRCLVFVCWIPLGNQRLLFMYFMSFPGVNHVSFRSLFVFKNLLFCHLFRSLIATQIVRFSFHRFWWNCFTVCQLKIHKNFSVGLVWSLFGMDSYRSIIRILGKRERIFHFAKDWKKSWRRENAFNWKNMLKIMSLNYFPCLHNHSRCWIRQCQYSFGSFYQEVKRKKREKKNFNWKTWWAIIKMHVLFIINSIRWFLFFFSYFSSFAESDFHFEDFGKKIRNVVQAWGETKKTKTRGKKKIYWNLFT